MESLHPDGSSDDLNKPEVTEMSVDNDASFWKWVAGGLLSAISGGFGFIKWHQAQMAKKADKAEMANCLRHIEDLYKNAEKDRALTRDLHDRAMAGIAEGQRQIIDVLTRR
jgi:Mg2+ and Co2+ transporter CorA